MTVGRYITWVNDRTDAADESKPASPPERMRARLQVVERHDAESTEVAHRPGKLNLRQRLLDPLIASKHPRGFNSLGAGIGLAAGFACPIGLQFFTITSFRVFFKFNTILALGLSLVSNPFTVAPLYYGYYRLGSLILGQPASMSMEGFEGALDAALQAGYFWDTIPALLKLGKDVIVRWSVSALILATVFGVLGYYVSWKIQEKFAGQQRKSVSLGREESNPEPGQSFQA